MQVRFLYLAALATAAPSARAFEVEGRAIGGSGEIVPGVGDGVGAGNVRHRFELDATAASEVCQRATCSPTSRQLVSTQLPEEPSKLR